MSITRKIIIIGYLFLVFKKVVSNEHFLEQIGPKITEKLEVLFEADKQLCDLVEESSALLTSQLSETQGKDETKKMLGVLQAHLQNRIDKAEAGKQIKECEELLAIYDNSINIKGIEYMKLQSKKAEQKFKNKEVFDAVIEVWTKDLKFTDEVFTWTESEGARASTGASDQDPQTNANDKQKTLVFPKDETEKISSKETNDMLRNTDQLIKNIENIYGETMKLLSPEYTSGPLAQEAQLQTDYDEMVKKLWKFKRNPRILDQNPKITINDLLRPVAGKPSFDCNSPVRKELLTISVIKGMLDQGQHKIAHEGSTVSIAFLQWLTEKLIMMRDLMLKNGSCDFNKWDTATQFVAMEIQSVSGAYTKEGANSRRDLEAAASKDDPKGIRRAKQELTTLKADFLEDYTPLRDTLRNCKNCARIAEKIERLINGRPLPQWQREIYGRTNEPEDDEWTTFNKAVVESVRNDKKP